MQVMQSSNNAWASKLIRLHLLQVDLVAHATVGACVAPIFSDESELAYEWLKHYTALGFQGFHMYWTDTQLRWSDSDPIVKTSQFQPFLYPMTTWYQHETFKDEDRWYASQHTLQSDCVYRHRHTYKYLAFFDLDEFLIVNELLVQPGQIHSEMQLATFLQKIFPPQSASVGLYRWPYQDCRSDKEKTKVTLIEEGQNKKNYVDHFTHREQGAEPNEFVPNTADKLIVRPELVKLFYLHVLQEAVSNATADMVNTPPSIAYIKHLRQYASSHGCKDLTTEPPPDNPKSVFIPWPVWFLEVNFLAWDWPALLICFPGTTISHFDGNVKE